MENFNKFKTKSGHNTLYIKQEKLHSYRFSKFLKTFDYFLESKKSLESNCKIKKRVILLRINFDKKWSEVSKNTTYAFDGNRRYMHFQEDISNKLLEHLKKSIRSLSIISDPITKAECDFEKKTIIIWHKHEQIGCQEYFEYPEILSVPRDYKYIETELDNFNQKYFFILCGKLEVVTGDESRLLIFSELKDDVFPEGCFITKKRFLDLCSPRFDVLDFEKKLIEENKNPKNGSFNKLRNAILVNSSAVDKSFLIDSSVVSEAMGALKGLDTKNKYLFAGLDFFLGEFLREYQEEIGFVELSQIKGIILYRNKNIVKIWVYNGKNIQKKVLEI